jgi:DNA-directed RNA polymerase subunit RPC12/RpoP
VRALVRVDDPEALLLRRVPLEGAQAEDPGGPGPEGGRAMKAYPCARCGNMLWTEGHPMEVVHCPGCGQEYTIFRVGEGS